MRSIGKRWGLSCALAIFCCMPVLRAAAQENKPKPAEPQDGKSSPAAKPSAEQNQPAPLPAEKSVEQSMQLDGKTLHYSVTVGAYPTRDEQGKTVGEVVVTAYTMAGKDRPVTFAFNGGPGAASAFLNMGAIGPKHLDFGNDGESPSRIPVLTDNQGTWLDFTDLVFIDPIGTGFSRSLVPDDQAKKLFYSTEPDIHYLSRVIYHWLVKNGRLESRKYVVGESYGGFRGPRIAYYLQSQLGVGVNGMVLISPYLNPTIETSGYLFSPLPWMLTLPSVTAANLERQHKLTAAAMQPVIAYDEGEYATTLIKGNSDPAATAAMIQRVIQMTGLDPTFVKQSGGRIETEAYLREAHREQSKLGSVYDSNVTMPDPFPYEPEQRANDPILAKTVAPLTTAMVNFLTQTVGWKVDARYNLLSYDVGRLWQGGKELREGSVAQLRQAVAADPELRVIVAHGWNDLSCPFMGSVLSVNQMPILGDPTRVAVHEYPGGHMFYTRQSSRLALRSDVMAMYAKH